VAALQRIELERGSFRPGPFQERTAGNTKGKGGENPLARKRSEIDCEATKGWGVKKGRFQAPGQGPKWKWG